MTRKHLLFILALLCGQVSFAQLIGFETGIPKQFQTSDKGKITLSTQYYKEGKQSLKWDFRSGSKLNVAGTGRISSGFCGLRHRGATTAISWTR